jgi:hypothetical protein
MDSIEEQWNPPSSPDIVSDSWMNIADAKKAVKIWILDDGESWGPSAQNNKTPLQLYCILSTCSFYIRIAQKKNDPFEVTSYTPHNCPPSTYAQFKPRNSAWYLARLDTSNQRRYKSELGYIINYRMCHTCRHGERENVFEIQLMGMREQASA